MPGLNAPGWPPALACESSCGVPAASMLDAELTATSLQAYVYASGMGLWRAERRARATTLVCADGIARILSDEPGGAQARTHAISVTTR